MHRFARTQGMRMIFGASVAVARQRLVFYAKLRSHRGYRSVTIDGGRRIAYDDRQLA